VSVGAGVIATTARGRKRGNAFTTKQIPSGRPTHTWTNPTGRASVPEMAGSR